MANLDISDLTRAYVAQIAGGLCADIVQLKAENAMLRAENNQLKQEKQTQEKSNG